MGVGFVGLPSLQLAVELTPGAVVGASFGIEFRKAARPIVSGLCLGLGTVWSVAALVPAVLPWLLILLWH